MKTNLITPIANEDRDFITAVIAKIRWLVGYRKIETLSRIVDISASEVDTISRSSKYLDEIKYLMRTERTGIELKNWIDNWRGMKPKFAKRMGIDVETTNTLFRELENGLDNRD